MYLLHRLSPLLFFLFHAARSCLSALCPSSASFHCYFLASSLCLCVTSLHFSPSQILPPLSAFCSSDFFPTVSLSFPIWLLSPSTHVYFLAPVLLSTFPFQVLLCLISVFIFFYFLPAFLNSDQFKILQEKLLL